MLGAMVTIRIEDELWQSAPDLRRREWGVLIADVTRDGSPMPALSISSIELGSDHQTIRIALWAEDGQRSPRDIERSAIERELQEYLSVIERLGEEGLTAQRAEALDMAKRVVHDQAGRRLGALLPELSEDLETRRRFFSLLVAVVTDTTGKRTGHLMR